MFTESLKIGIRRTFLYDLIWPIKHKRQHREWISGGRSVPPPAIVKHRTIEKYAKTHNHQLFVETGTYRGDTVHAVQGIFKEIYSVELGYDLAKQARARFREQKNVSILQGDSGLILPKLLSQIRGSCLFWLDANFSVGVPFFASRETPIYQELKGIFQHPNKNHTILIDDARDFDGQKGYPEIAQLRDFVLKKFPQSTFEVEDDIIRICQR